MRDIFDVPPIGIDIDGTITEDPQFFNLLISIWPAPVYIITFRHDQERAMRDLRQYGIDSDNFELVLVNGHEKKAAEITKRGIKIMFDDTDEVICPIPGNVLVFKVRNDGNFDFPSKRWFYDKNTGIDFDEYVREITRRRESPGAE